ncbi:MAG: MarR family winged helix-turn-helix transcriptional regulator [Candidatus Gastranaerophilales bacterium]|nr:MarR family winged helix-turn-helix transcriptional regulator [Candidatus Gastranaerophilales bacterium]
MDKLKLKEQSEQLIKFHRDISGFYNDYAKSVGLTYASLEVLGIIWYKKCCLHEEVTQKTVTQKAYLPKQTVNAIIKAFIKHDLIKPLVESGLDKRNKVIEFTENGKEFAEKVITKMKEAEYNALDSLGEEKRIALVEIISQYRDNLKIV